MKILVLLCALAAPVLAADELVILHVNDLHGQVMPREYLGTDLPPSFLHKDNGGLFSVATRVKQVRHELWQKDPALEGQFALTGDDGILMLEAGDLWSGTLDDAASKGANAADLIVSPSLDVDAACPGNHAWDFGQKRWEELSKKMGAHHPQLCANIGRAGGPLPFLKPWAIVPVRGVRVGIVGLITPTALTESLPENTKGLEVRDPIDALAQALDEMRALPEGERPDFTIALSHVAFDRQLVHNGARGQGFRMLAEMDDGAPQHNVDLVIDGHSHLDLEREIDADTWLVQADHYALKMGEIRIPWDFARRRRTGPPRIVKHSLFTEHLPVDEQMLAAEQKKVDAARAKNDAELVPAEGDLAVACVPRSEMHRLASPSGDLLMRAMLEAADDKGGARPDVALINQSGVREGLYASRSGSITLGAVHAICPFGNAVETCEMRARDLVVLIGHYGIQQFARMSWAGLEVSALQEGRTEAAALARKLTSLTLLAADGKRVNLMDPAEHQRIVRVAAPSFLMSRELAPYALPGSRKKTGFTDAELLRNYLKELAARDGKVTKAAVAAAVGEPTRLVIED